MNTSRSSTLSWHHFTQIQLAHYNSEDISIQLVFESVALALFLVCAIEKNQEETHIHDWLTMKFYKLWYDRLTNNSMKKKTH